MSAWRTISGQTRLSSKTHPKSVRIDSDCAAVLEAADGRLSVYHPLVERKLSFVRPDYIKGCDARSKGEDHPGRCGENLRISGKFADSRGLHDDPCSTAGAKGLWTDRNGYRVYGSPVLVPRLRPLHGDCPACHRNRRTDVHLVLDKFSAWRNP